MRSKKIIPLLGMVLVLLMFAGTALANVVELRFMANPRRTAFGDDVNELLVEIFNELNPDIRVRYEPASGAWQDRASVEMAAGTAPDVLAGWEHFFRNWLEMGQALPLDNYLPAGYLDDFVPSHVALYNIDGRQLALPHYTGVSALFFNRDMFEAAGLGAPDETWNRSSLLDAARKLTRRDAGGTVTQYGTDVQVAWDRVILTVWEHGGRAIDDGLFVGDRLLLDEPGGIEAIGFLQELIHDYQVAPAWPNLGTDPWNGFWRGDTVAMWQTGSWDVNSTLQNAVMDWDVAVRPRGPEGHAAAVHTSDGFMVWSGTQHPEEAVRFLLFLTSPDAQEIMMYEANLQPARLSLGRQYMTQTAGARQGINMAVFIEQTAYARPAPLFTNQSRVSEIVIPYLNQMIYQNTMPARAGVEEMVRQVNAVLRGERR